MKLISKLFTVPKGEKVTEKAMLRVLISSICGIILCVSGLVTSTWAWYTVNVETASLSSQVATHKPMVQFDGDWVELRELKIIAGDSAVMKLRFDTDATPGSLARTPGRYLIITHVDDQSVPLDSWWICLNDDAYTDWTADLTISALSEVTVQFATAWHAPETGTQLQGNTLVLGTEESSQAQTPGTEVQPNEGAQQPQEGAQQPQENTEQQPASNNG